MVNLTRRFLAIAGRQLGKSSQFVARRRDVAPTCTGFRLTQAANSVVVVVVLGVVVLLPKTKNKSVGFVGCQSKTTENDVKARPLRPIGPACLMPTLEMHPALVTDDVLYWKWVEWMTTFLMSTPLMIMGPRPDSDDADQSKFSLWRRAADWTLFALPIWSATEFDSISSP